MTPSPESAEMETEGKWQRFVGKAKETWGDLTDDELTQFEGKYDQAVGYLKQKYGEATGSFEDWWNEEKDEA